MDTLETLRSIATTLPGLPQDSVESMLVTFDTLVHFGDQGHRPEAAGFLREAAAQCGNQSQRDRLLRAADSVDAQEPVALTPEGLTWQQAAAAQTISGDDWVEPPEPVYAASEPEPEEDEEEDEQDEAEEPGQLEGELDESEEDDEDED